MKKIRKIRKMTKKIRKKKKILIINTKLYQIEKLDAMN